MYKRRRRIRLERKMKRRRGQKGKRGCDNTFCCYAPSIPLLYKN
jgi:hypothetical protein